MACPSPSPPLGADPMYILRWCIHTHPTQCLATVPAHAPWRSGRRRVSVATTPASTRGKRGGSSDQTDSRRVCVCVSTLQMRLPLARRPSRRLFIIIAGPYSVPPAVFSPPPLSAPSNLVGFALASAHTRPRSHTPRTYALAAAASGLPACRRRPACEPVLEISRGFAPRQTGRRAESEQLARQGDSPPVSWSTPSRAAFLSFRCAFFPPSLPCRRSFQPRKRKTGEAGVQACRPSLPFVGKRHSGRRPVGAEPSLVYGLCRSETGCCCCCCCCFCCLCCPRDAPSHDASPCGAPANQSTQTAHPAVVARQLQEDHRHRRTATDCQPAICGPLRPREKKIARPWGSPGPPAESAERETGQPALRSIIAVVLFLHRPSSHIPAGACLSDRPHPGDDQIARPAGRRQIGHPCAAPFQPPANHTRLRTSTPARAASARLTPSRPSRRIAASARARQVSDQITVLRWPSTCRLFSFLSSGLPGRPRSRILKRSGLGSRSPCQPCLPMLPVLPPSSPPPLFSSDAQS